MNNAQLLKAYGNLPDVALSDLDSASISADQLTHRWCGHPDHSDPEIVDADPNTLARFLNLTVEQAYELQSLHNRAASKPGWPTKKVKMFVDWDSFSRTPNWRPTTESDLKEIIHPVWPWNLTELMDIWFGEPLAKVARWWADQAWKRVGQNHEQIQDGVNGSEHQIHVTAKNIAGPTIGLGWFPSGEINDHVNQHIDTIRFSLTGLARLFCHEDGHNHGEEHQFNGQNVHQSVMSYNPPNKFYGFSTGEVPYPIPRDKSIDSLLAKYGPPTDTEPKPKPESVGRIIFNDGKTYNIVDSGGGGWY